MDTAAAALMVVLLIANLLPYGQSSQPSTVPAFMWSRHLDETREAVNYKILFAQDLAKSVLSEGGWSNILCRRKKAEQPVDLVLVFVGRELRSVDISGKNHADPALVNLLETSYTSSNFSMAFPYVAASEDQYTMESSLMSGFMEACEHDLDVSNIAFVESCAVEGQNFEKLADLSSVHDYLVSRAERRPRGQADLVVVCNGDSQSSQELNALHFESNILSNLISSVEQLGTKYAMLYVSDPFRPSQYSSYQKIQRFLAEGKFGNESANSTTCDEVCKIKSSLLEGLFVAIVLLIILLSGLCCMAGIDGQTRFETPQDS